METSDLEPGTGIKGGCIRCAGAGKQIPIIYPFPHLCEAFSLNSVHPETPMSLSNAGGRTPQTHVLRISTENEKSTCT